MKWVHENAMSDNRYLPETMGPGIAFFDFDNDGWLDIFMVNSGKADFYTPAAPLKNALYKNNRDGTFTDVTDKAGVAGGQQFGMGCAIADYDNDGYPDILVTAYGRCTLYHNSGDGTFTDVTDKAGVAAPGWTTSAVWFDYDNDGKLDLFLCSFVQFSLTSNVFCGDNKLGKRFYCIPRVFKGTPSLLFHNNGNGTFTEVSAGTDIQRAIGKALGVVATDINNDGLMDLFVANDTVQNFLFANRGKGKWDEIALASEVGFSANGTPRSGMGVDAADINGDGKQDLFVANVDQEMFSLYRNDGNEFFSDVAAANGVAQSTRLLSGWGLKFFDYDNDGFVSTVTTAGIGVMTCRASCSWRWKTPSSIPDSPGSSWPPARAWPMSIRSSSGVAPSVMAASGLIRPARSSPFAAPLSAEMNGFITVVNAFSGRATKIAVRSALTIE